MTQYIQQEDIIYLVYNPKKVVTVTQEDKLYDFSAQELIDSI